MREESGSQRRSGAITGPQQNFGMFVLRLWMWAVPVVMFAAAVTFGGIALVDGSWGLFVIMLVMAVTAIALFVFHWWVLYRFGSRSR